MTPDRKLEQLDVTLTDLTTLALWTPLILLSTPAIAISFATLLSITANARLFEARPTSPRHGADLPRIFNAILSWCVGAAVIAIALH
jgi:hypothetical protein